MTWVRRMEIKKLEKQTFDARVLEATGVIKRTIQNKFMGYLFDRYEAVIEEENNAKEARNKNITSLVFNFLKDRVKHKKIYLKIKEIKSKKDIKRYLIFWKKCSNICKATSTIHSWANKRIFKAIQEESSLKLKIQRIEELLLQQNYHKFYRQLRISFNIDKTDE